MLGSKKFSPINEENKHDFVKKLQAFIAVRIDYIMCFPRIAIPLKNLVEQLHLCSDTMKTLTEAKMEHSDTIFQIEKRQNAIVKGQLCDMFNDMLKHMVSRITAYQAI